MGLQMGINRDDFLPCIAIQRLKNVRECNLLTRLPIRPPGGRGLSTKRLSRPDEQDQGCNYPKTCAGDGQSGRGCQPFVKSVTGQEEEEYGRNQLPAERCVWKDIAQRIRDTGLHLF